MSKEIESRVSAALRPVAPREDFSRDLLPPVFGRQAVFGVVVLGKPGRVSDPGSRYPATSGAAATAAERTRGAARSGGGIAYDQSETEPCLRSGQESIDIAER
jgi:hypothetical protein